MKKINKVIMNSNVYTFSSHGYSKHSFDDHVGLLETIRMSYNLALAILFRSLCFNKLLTINN